jgi:hypothetical protein
MGRYYSGDIEGKFWFALQSSDAADRFGVTGQTPAELQYFFTEDDLEGVEVEIKNIEKTLGEKKQILDDFFKDERGYTDSDIEALGVSKDELSDYADLGLGIKIRDQIKEFGTCDFTAEL